MGLYVPNAIAQCDRCKATKCMGTNNLGIARSKAKTEGWLTMRLFTDEEPHRDVTLCPVCTTALLEVWLLCGGVDDG